MRFASLGSGSKGNATLVEVEGRCLMIDCGFSMKETIKRLERLGKTVESLEAILVTHEHGDHISGVERLARKYSLPIWASHGTASYFNGEGVEINCFNSHADFEITAFQVKPIAVPHDAKEPVQFVFSDGQKRLGILTDTGSITPFITESLSGCDALLLESNHDEQLLQQSVYPQSLKQRVAGRLGHLSNRQAAACLEAMDCSALQHMIAAHLSDENNHRELVSSVLSSALNCEDDWIGFADQNSGFDWRTIG
ncbi:MAG: MBL fold metallo-hydrolase [Gammaproteobacteria bacterium]|nr:MAG: MBL fold metallo-hydrolase [Gammaproteobacteria bacterium]RLA22460.1 MAG: MBL fold metallo-hydrolase [Gammaproteobacteria bacterium]